MEKCFLSYSHLHLLLPFNKYEAAGVFFVLILFGWLELQTFLLNELANRLTDNSQIYESSSFNY